MKSLSWVLQTCVMGPHTLTSPGGMPHGYCIFFDGYFCYHAQVLYTLTRSSHTLCIVSWLAIDYHAKDRGSEVTRILCCFYHDPLQTKCRKAILNTFMFEIMRVQMKCKNSNESYGSKLSI